MANGHWLNDDYRIDIAEDNTTEKHLMFFFDDFLLNWKHNQLAINFLLESFSFQIETIKILIIYQTMQKTSTIDL